MDKLIWNGETEFVRASDVSSCKGRESSARDGEVTTHSYFIDIYTKTPHTKTYNDGSGGTIPSLVLGPYKDQSKAISKMKGIATLVELARGVTDNG